MKNTKRIIRTCLCALLLLTMTGCSSEGEFNWSQLSVSTQSNVKEQKSEESSELKVSMPTASGEMDPLTNSSASMQGLFALCFEGVMRLSDSYQPENRLAESVVRTETGYRVTLRSGVLFHDGKGLTAQDVADSYEHIKDAQESPWKSVVEPILSLKVTGEREFEVETKSGYAALYALTFPIVSSQEGNTYPAGTGPYRITAYTEGVSMDLTRWEDWWRTPALIPSIHVLARENSESELATFQTGMLDVCTADMLTVSSVTQRDSVSRQDYPTGQAELLLPNLDGLLGDAMLRYAVAQALDKSDIVSNTYQNHGVAVDVPVIPNSWLAERTESIDCDPEAAGETLEQLGWKDLDGDGYAERYVSVTAQEEDETQEVDGEQSEDPSEALQGLLGESETDPGQNTLTRLTLRILTNEEDTSSHKDAARRLVTQLAEAGIEASVTTVGFDQLEKTIESGEYDLLLVGYQLMRNGNLSSLLRSDGKNNSMGYSSSEMDAALDSLETAQTQEEYFNAMQKVYDRIMEDLPIYTICMRTRTQLTGSSVTVSAVPHSGEPYRGIETWTNLEEE